MTHTISSAAHAAILRAAAQAAPREACGLLLGEGTNIHAATVTANVHSHPLTHFEIDPAALIAAHRSARAGGPALLGYWHSHPNGRVEPSATDREQASGDGRIWAIAAGGAVRLWVDRGHGFDPLPYAVQDG